MIRTKDKLVTLEDLKIALDNQNSTTNVEIPVFDGIISGLVPAPTETNTIGIFKGATADEDGTAGLVPPPLNMEV